jgi:hypothetical protein
MVQLAIMEVALLEAGELMAARPLVMEIQALKVQDQELAAGPVARATIVALVMAVLAHVRRGKTLFRAQSVYRLETA